MSDRVRIWISERYVPATGQYKLEAENFANEVQLIRIEELNAEVVEHRFVSKHGDESIRQWALVQVPDKGPCFIREDGGLQGVGGLPYPWCRGNPTQAHCAAAGNCRRDPNCGE